MQLSSLTPSRVAMLIVLAGPAWAAAPAKDVNVVNTPSVSVANTPTVNVGNSPTVTVGNTSASPVPVVDSGKTVLAFNVEQIVPVNGGWVSFGQVDVSAFHEIRILGDPSGIGALTYTLKIEVVAPDGSFRMPLDTITGLSPFFSRFYELPGTMLEFTAMAECSGGSCPSTVPMRVVMFGR